MSIVLNANKEKLLLKKTKRGKIFYGCSRWPNCDYASWTKPEELENKTQKTKNKKSNFISFSFLKKQECLREFLQ